MSSPRLRAIVALDRAVAQYLAAFSRWERREQELLELARPEDAAEAHAFGLVCLRAAYVELFNPEPRALEEA